MSDKNVMRNLAGRVIVIIVVVGIVGISSIWMVGNLVGSRGDKKVVVTRLEESRDQEEFQFSNLVESRKMWNELGGISKLPPQLEKYRDGYEVEGFRVYFNHVVEVAREMGVNMEAIIEPDGWMVVEEELVDRIKMLGKVYKQGLMSVEKFEYRYDMYVTAGDILSTEYELEILEVSQKNNSQLTAQLAGELLIEMTTITNVFGISEEELEQIFRQKVMNLDINSSGLEIKRVRATISVDNPGLYRSLLTSLVTRKAGDWSRIALIDLTDRSSTYVIAKIVSS